MNFFKKDPVKELKKLLEDLKVPQELRWHRTNQEDLYHIVEILEKELPMLEQKTIEESQEHPQVKYQPLFTTILRLFSRINAVVQTLKKQKKRNVAIEPTALAREFDELDGLLNQILREEYLFLEEQSGRKEIPQEIDDASAQALLSVAMGHEVKFIISPEKATFWATPTINHDEIEAHYGGIELGGTILPFKRLIEVPGIHSRYDHEGTLILFRRLGASEKTRVLHGFLIQHKGAYLGKFICKYGGMEKIELKKLEQEHEIVAQLPYGGARETVVRLLRQAEARKDWAAVEKYQKLLRELMSGD